MAANLPPPEITKQAAAAAAAEEEEEKESSVDKSKVANRSRLIVRLGALLVSHSGLVSGICCIAGLIAILFLPMLAKNTYISENALMPGSANSLLSYQDVSEGNKLITDITRIINDKKRSADLEIPKLLAQYMQSTGAETYHHTLPQPRKSPFNPLHFFLLSTPTPLPSNQSSFATSTVGIIRAPAGDGKESIVLVSPYNLEKFRSEYLSESSSLGLAFSIFSLLSRASWLSKDVIWVATDSRFGDYASVSAWLNEYHNPNPNFGPGPDFGRGDDLGEGFKRAGTMACAIVFKVVERESGKGRREKVGEERENVAIYSEGSNGQMPNLDLVNVVHYLGVHRQGFRVRVGKLGFLEGVRGIRFLGEVMSRVGRFLRALNPDWKFDVSSGEYVEGAATLASSVFAQAVGVPTGPHGAFRDYQIDAVTLELSPKFSLANENARSAFLLRSGRLIEGTVRSVNNLLEKFHQSFFLYFLTGPNKFISVGVYMIPFALLISPLPILAASLFNFNLTPNPNPNPNPKNPWRWLKPAKFSLLIQTWAVIVSLLPFYISQITDLPPNYSFLIWTLGSLFTLVILYSIFGSPNSTEIEWRLLKAVMIASVSIGLCLMSIINFSTAQIGALFIVPMCLLARPIRAKMDNSIVNLIVSICNLVMVIVGFPLSGFLVREIINGNFGEMNLGVFWESMEYLWAWNSASFLYLILVHLPCWLLFVHILFHPCN
ncbi:hypothetical protein LUZ60_009232 [Juncus effusus]|nr:hypothetical protein LUZ60_009232 [Juncus effusus]